MGNERRTGEGVGGHKRKLACREKQNSLAGPGRKSTEKSVDGIGRVWPSSLWMGKIGGEETNWFGGGEERRC